MMKKFELCDSSDDKNLLIPSAFGKMPKVEYSEYKGDDVRIYILQFRDYMPLALIHRFTAKKISEALDDNFWYTGIVLKDSKSNTLAMVHADREAKRIYVRIKGAEKLGMWEYIRRDLSAIASSYASIPYDELVSLDGNVENNVSYSDLTSYIQSNKAVYYHPKIKRDFNVGYLIGLFESKEGTINKFEANNSEIKIRGERPEQVPNYVIQILNNNTPNITTHIETNISINVIQELSSSLKGDLSYLISELNESNNEIIKSLETLINFANESKSTTDINQIRENGWARKIKSALGVLSKYGDEIKKVDDGAGALKSLMNNIKQLSGHFKLNDVIDWINQLLP
ncbi:hypothetical protein EON78_06575 [bacterium]|nr:MAG: hypothetical protein EON78_06575 [bacterium]